MFSSNPVEKDVESGMNSTGICRIPENRIISTKILTFSGVGCIANAITENISPNVASAGLSSSHKALRVTNAVDDTRAFKFPRKLLSTKLACDCEW